MVEMRYNINGTSGGWKKINDFQYNINGTSGGWKKIQEGWYNTNGTTGGWKKFYSSGPQSIVTHPTLTNNLNQYYDFQSYFIGNSGRTNRREGYTNNLISSGTRYAFSFWVKFNTLPDRSCILRIYDTPGTKELAFGLHSSTQWVYEARWPVNERYDEWRNLPKTIAINVWYHFMVVCASTWVGSDLRDNLKIWFDGELIWNGVSLSSSLFLYPQFFDAEISMNTGTPMISWLSQTFDGYLDELGIWRQRNITDSEALDLYNSGNGLPYD